MPNITATYGTGMQTDVGQTCSGAIEFEQQVGSTFAGNGASQYYKNGFNFYASRCSSVYGSSNTVTPISESCLFIIRY